jgi:periplasmic protein TonB
VLPTPPSMMAFVAAPPPPPTAPAAPAAARSGAAQAGEEVNPAAAPVEAPRRLRPEPPIDTSFDRAFGDVGGVPGGVVGGVVGGMPDAGAAAPAAAAGAPVRVGGNIKPPTSRPSDVARVPGDCTVGPRAGRGDHRGDHRPDGRVQDARVLRSIPLLDQAALDAVRQWEFTPTCSTACRCRSS